jgi:hypothetical protein
MSFVTSHLLSRYSKKQHISTEQKTLEVDMYLDGINQSTNSVCSTASGLFIQSILKGEYNGDYRSFISRIIKDSERIFKIIIVTDIDNSPNIDEDEKIKRYDTAKDDRYNIGTDIMGIISYLDLNYVEAVYINEENKINTIYSNILLLENNTGMFCTTNATTVGVVKKDDYYFLLDTHKNDSGSKFICSKNSLNVWNYINNMYIGGANVLEMNNGIIIVSLN